MAFAALACTVMPRLATAQCSYNASPSIALSFDQTKLDPITGIPAVAEDWKVGCSLVGCDPAKTKYFWDDVRLVYAAEPATEITGVGSLAAGDDPTVSQGHILLNEPLPGVRLIAMFSAGCGDSGGVASSDLIMAPQTQPFVIPPYLPPPEQITIKVDDPSFPGLPIAIGTQVPLGYKFHIAVALGATPKGAETLGVHVVGAGIAFEKYYEPDPSAPDANIGEQLAVDPAAQFLAKTLDPIKFWLDFENRGSQERMLTVIPYDQDGSPIPPVDGGTPDAGGSSGFDAGGADDGNTDASNAGAAGSTDTTGSAGTIAAGGSSGTAASGAAGTLGASSPAASPTSHGSGCAIASTTASMRGSFAAFALSLAGAALRRRRRARS